MPKAPKRKRLATATAPNRKEKQASVTGDGGNEEILAPSTAAISKREKREQKHQQWLAKLSHNYRDMHDQRKRRREKQPKFGDLSEFSAFLNSIQSAQPAPSLLQQQENSARVLTSQRHNLPSELAKAAAVTSTSSVSPEKPLQNNRAKTTVHVRSKKGRKKALIGELLQFQAVLRHPAFQASPLDTIQQHIRNTASKID